MGFRSTFISEDYNFDLPKWFIEKYKSWINFNDRRNNNTFPISSKFETKFYLGKEEELFLDIQKIIKEKKLSKFIIVLLHECGGITRVQIEKDKILLSEPSDWKEVEEVTHNYCYGCSDI